MGRKSTSDLEKWSTRTDIRLQFMKELIASIQVIKMYAWELSFAQLVDKIRKFEVEAIRGYFNQKALRASLMTVTRISVLLTILAHIYSGESITARKLFVITSIFNYLNYTMVSYWPESFRYLSEIKVAVARIQSFLEQKSMNRYSEYIDTKKDDFSNLVETNRETDNMFQLLNVSASWSKKEKSGGVYDISLNIKDNSLSAIIGPVGSGKTTLLNLLIDEIKCDKGEIILQDQSRKNISYASQEPWLFYGSIRKNIIFIEKFDEDRYNEVIRVCALEHDFQQLPHGDSTIVGENGVMLSGGQKVRVNLARAVYKRAASYLLDDPLSAVDAHVAKHIYNECIRGFLKNKAVVLVTHQTQYINNVDHIILMDTGRIVSQGKYNEIKLENLLKDNENMNETTSEKNMNDNLEKINSDSVINADDEDVDEDDDEVVDGSVAFDILKEYVLSASQKLVIFVVSICLIKHLMMSSIDYYLTNYINWEENHSLYNSTDNEHLAGISLLRQSYAIQYTIMTIFLVVLFFLRDFSFYNMALDASINLHNKLLNGVIRTSISFFHKNSSGRILNRFSRDVNAIDDALPDVLSDTLTVCACLILI